MEAVEALCQLEALRYALASPSPGALDAVMQSPHTDPQFSTRVPGMHLYST